MYVIYICTNTCTVHCMLYMYIEYMYSLYVVYVEIGVLDKTV